MKKIYFDVSDELLDGINLLASELNIDISKECLAEFTIEASEVHQDQVNVELNGKKAKISYGGGKIRFFRGLGLVLEQIEQGNEKFSKLETPSFETNGAMFDMSRNAVMRPSTVKYIMRRMALMGLNSFMLYTEDTYEVYDRPYFGHMRGRYSGEEIRDMDAYAKTLGIELIPCVQFLAHLTMALKWKCARDYRDTEDILLVGSEETYKLIDDMLRSIADNFSSRRIHIGLDEAHEMGLGKYLDKHGYRDRFDIFCEHLEKVSAMAKGYGFSPMMWSDMFFRIASADNKYYEPDVDIPKSVIDRVPKDVQQVYWDYYHDDKETYCAMIDKHREFTDNIFFSGGIWTWIGPCPHYSRTIRRSISALTACKEKGIKEVNATVWHNGAESSLITSLPGLQLYAEFDYNGHYDREQLEKRFEFCCGAKFSDFMALETADHPDGGDGNATRYALFNDPLIGLYDKHIEGLNTRRFYGQLKTELEDAGPNSGMLKPAFDMMRSLVNVLELKADFGVRLKQAYDLDEQFQLKALSDESLIISHRIEELRKTHRESWFTYNKPFGWEIFDSYYGTLLSRFSTVRHRISDYLAGEIDNIEELEEDRLWFDCRTEPGEYSIPDLNMRFQRIYTACVSYTVVAGG